MKSIIHQLKDKDTLFVFFDKVLVAFKGPLIIAAILLFLDVKTQGIWYTFVSLSALTGIAELGFTTIISQFVSHEYAHLRYRNGFLTGKKSSLDRAFGLIRYAIKIYCYVIPVAVLILGIVGYYFFKEQAGIVVSVWLVYCLLSGLNLIVTLLQSIYKGFDHVARSHLIISLSNITSVVFILLALATGAKLAALPISVAVFVGVSLYLLFKLDRKFWIQFYRHKIKTQHSWFDEIIKLQSKYAVSFLCGYFIFNLHVPLTFKFQTEITAGQLGLTLSVAKALSGFSYVWLLSKLPSMNVMAAKKQKLQLEEFFWKKAKLSLGTFAFGSICFLVVVYLANEFQIYNTRVLPLSTLALVFLAEFATVCLSIYAIYVRAHKIEPFHKPSLISAFIIAAISYGFITRTSLLNLYLALNLYQWFIMLPLFLYFGKKAMTAYYQKVATQPGLS